MKEDTNVITDDIICQFIAEKLDVNDFGHLVIPDDSRLNAEALSIIKRKFWEFISGLDN